MAKKKLTEAEAKKLIATANQKLDAALAVAGEIQRAGRAKGTPSTPTTKTAAQHLLELRLKKAAQNLNYAPAVERMKRLARELNRSS